MKNAEVAFHRFRFDSPFQQGFDAGGRLLVDAALVLERDDRTISATSSKSDDEIADAASRQEFVVENWARQDGCWIVDPHKFYREKNYRFFTATEERRKSTPRKTTLFIRFVESASMMIWRNSSKGLLSRIQYVLQPFWRLRGILVSMKTSAFY